MTTTLVRNDLAVFDADDAISIAEDAMIVCHGQNSSCRIFRDLDEKLHHRLTVLAIEGGRRLVRKNDRRLSG